MSTGHGDDLRAAMVRAHDMQRRTIAANMAAAGVRWDTPISESTRPLWDQDAWARAVEAEVVPAAQQIAGQILGLIRRRYNPVGMADPTPIMVALARDRALAGGPPIGRRLTMKTLTAAAVDLEAVRAKIAAAPQRYGGIVHPESQSTIADAYQQAFGVLDDLVANVGQHMGNAATALLGEAANNAQPNLVQHVWTSALMETTREAHADADGQVQDAGDSFDVGGESLAYPGDPSGSDENVCGCVCWLELVGVEATGAESADVEDVA